MPFSNAPWSNFSKADYSDEQWRKACLVCNSDCLKDSTPKSCCKLPVKEPSGTYNINGIKAAYSALRGARGGVNLSADERAKAMSRVRGLYREAGLELPAALEAAAWLEASGTGTAWKHGKHQVWINGKPKTLYVPKETIIPTFNRMKDKLKMDGLKLGIDHLDENILNSNPILKKMGPLDVGDIKRIGTDGEAIYLLDYDITNPVIQDLEAKGELPAFSIIGPIEADECERTDIDYVLKDVDVDRVDYVERGGCQECLVNAKAPGELLLTSKSSKEEQNMTEEDKKKQELEGNPADEDLDKKDGEDPEATENKATNPVDELTDIQRVESKLDQLSGIVMGLVESQGKVPDKIEAKLAELTEDKVKSQVIGYIRAGKAVPAQEEALMELAREDADGLAKFMEAAQPVVDLNTYAHYGEDDKKVVEAKVGGMTDEDYKKALIAVGEDPADYGLE